MSDAIPTVSITADYDAPSVAFTAIVAFFRDQVAPQIGPELRFRGGISWKTAADFEKSFDKLEDWEQSLADHLDSVSASMRSFPTQREFGANIDLKRQSVWMQIRWPEAEQDQVVQLLKSFESAAGLQRRDHAAPAARFDVRRRYVLPFPLDFVWFENAIAATAADVPGRAELFLSVQLNNGASRRFDRMDNLRTYATTNWALLDSLTLESQSRSASLRLHGDLTNGELEAAASRTVEAEAVRVLDSFQERHVLELLVTTQVREGLSQLATPEGSLDDAWFKMAMHEIRKVFPRHRYVNAEIEFVGRTGRVSFGDLTSWETAAVRDWPRIAGSRVWFSSNRATLDMRADHRRELVEFNLQAESRPTAETMLKDLLQRLKCTTLKENPYDAAASVSEFSVPVWTGKAFGEAVREAIPAAVGPKHFVEESYVRVGKEENQQFVTTADLDEYLKRLNGTEPYTATGLRAFGAKGRYFSIFVRSDLTKIEFRSSEPAHVLANLIKPFKKRLNLTRLKDREQARPTERKSFLDGTLGRIGLLLAGGIGALILQVGSELFPKYRLQIISPLGGKDQPRVIENTEVLVDWRIERHILYQDHIVTGKPGTIRLVNGAHAQEWTSQSPGQHRLALTPGTYYLQVTVPDIKTSDTVYITVAENRESTK